jgi:uncharacterized ion transporter superfamily protein YfcC
MIYSIYFAITFEKRIHKNDKNKSIHRQKNNNKRIWADTTKTKTATNKNKFKKENNKENKNESKGKSIRNKDKNSMLSNLIDNILSILIDSNKKSGRYISN